jgi:DNA-directed RNA polymerase subunit RPC12/RpoP
MLARIDEMPFRFKCGICGGEAPKQPCITEDGKCDLCGKEVILKEEAKKDKKK